MFSTELFFKIKSCIEIRATQQQIFIVKLSHVTLENQGGEQVPNRQQPYSCQVTRFLIYDLHI